MTNRAGEHPQTDEEPTSPPPPPVPGDGSTESILAPLPHDASSDPGSKGVFGAEVGVERETGPMDAGQEGMAGKN